MLYGGLADLGNKPEDGSCASPAPRSDQLRYREKELKEAMRQLEKERAEIIHQMGHRRDGGRVRDNVREVNWQIADDHAHLPNFA